MRAGMPAVRCGGEHAGRMPAVRWAGAGMRAGCPRSEEGRGDG